MALQNLRSSTADKRPTVGSMSDGQIALNTNATSPGVFFKDSGGSLIKVGPVHIGTTAPNSSPAGSTGNAVGEQWLDTTGGGYVFKIWDGSAWRSESGTFVDTSGDTMTGALILPSGTAAAPALGVGSADNGLYSSGTDQVSVSTNGTQRVVVDSSGNVGIGTSSPNKPLHVSTGSSDAEIRLQTDSGTEQNAYITLRQSSGDVDFYTVASGTNMKFHTVNTERMRITSGGVIGIGENDPSPFGGEYRGLDIGYKGSGISGRTGNPTFTMRSNIYFDGSNWKYGEGNTSASVLSVGGNQLIFEAAASGTAGATATLSEKFRIDSSGRLLVGTSSARSAGDVIASLQVEGTGFQTSSLNLISNAGASSGNVSHISLGKSRGTSDGSNTVVASGDNLGTIQFCGADGTDLNSVAASFGAAVDGTPGANDMPGRLVFSTTADGASSPTEHFRIASNGDLTATDTTIGSNSDSRLKTNIADFAYDLETFKQYQPKTFDWKNPELHGNKTGQRGFIAQDVETIDAYWVGQQVVDKNNADAEFLDADRLAKTLKLDKKDAMYVSVIQQLLAKVETLEAKVAALEAG